VSLTTMQKGLLDTAPKNVHGDILKQTVNLDTGGGNQQVARGSQLSMLSAINAGNTGTNRPHQAKIFTPGRYTFTGRVRPTITNLRMGYQTG
jgi:hypothetical protein